MQKLKHVPLIKKLLAFGIPGYELLVLISNILLKCGLHHDQIIKLDILQLKSSFGKVNRNITI